MSGGRFRIEVFPGGQIKFQALLGGWENVAEGAYHQLLKG